MVLFFGACALKLASTYVYGYRMGHGQHLNLKNGYEWIGVQLVMSFQGQDATTM